jgi:hypothetical protein
MGDLPASEVFDLLSKYPNLTPVDVALSIPQWGVTEYIILGGFTNLEATFKPVHSTPIRSENTAYDQTSFRFPESRLSKLKSKIQFNTEVRPAEYQFSPAGHCRFEEDHPYYSILVPDHLIIHNENLRLSNILADADGKINIARRGLENQIYRETLDLVGETLFDLGKQRTDLPD